MIPHTEILKRASSISIEAMLLSCLLHWTGHVVYMDGSRLQQMVIYGELAECMESVLGVGQKKRWKDHLKTVMKAYTFPHEELESFAADHTKWRQTVSADISDFE